MAGTQQTTEGLPSFVVQTSLASSGNVRSSLDGIDVSTLTDKANAYVSDIDEGYRWFAESTALVESPFVVIPEGQAAVTPGRWILLSSSNTPNLLFVSNAQDFPAPVGGVITLATDTLYTVNGLVDIGSNRIVVPESSYLRGLLSARDGLVSTTSDALVTFTGSDALVQMENLGLYAPNGTLIDVTGTPVNLAFTSILGSADGIGNIRASEQVTLSNVILSCQSSGLNALGAGDTLKLSNVRINQSSGAGKLVDLGSSTWDFLTISNCSLLAAGTGTVLSGLAASGNIGIPGLAVVSSSQFEGGTILENITTGDARWTFTSNLGV